ncbi:hypothetical protein [Runella sp.]|jgi:hypothetical protein|uniref:hypothetical protein n=1 Tax=Runella sp. TaxID=1960881 RepID=UPI003015BF46
MKNLIIQFSNNVLSRSQMRAIKGGYEDEGGAVGCWPCKDDARFLCSIKIGGGCECNRSDLGKDCQRVEI